MIALSPSRSSLLSRLSGKKENAPTSYAATTAEQPSGMHENGTEGAASLTEIFNILKRRFPTILMSLLLSFLLAGIYAFLTTPLYTATTSLYIDPKGRGSLTVDPLQVNATVELNVIDSQVKLISSDTVLRRVVDSENLENDPEFTVEADTPITRLQRMFGIQNKAKDVADRNVAALRHLMKSVTVRRSERTFILDVDVVSQSPEKAAKIANAVARAYILDQQDNKVEVARRENEWLKTYLSELQNRLQEAENRVEAYKLENKIIGANGKSVSEQQLLDISNELVKARTKTIESQSKYNQTLASLKAGGKGDSIPEALRSGVIDKLRAQSAEIARLEANYRTTLGPRHPSLIEVENQARETKKLINDELARIADAAKNEYTISLNQEKALERNVENLKNDSSATGQKLIRLRELEREADAQRAVYEKFLKDKENLIRQSIDTSAARIISPAIPPLYPTSPRKVAAFAIALIAGLGLGVGLALLREQTRREKLRRKMKQINSHAGALTGAMNNAIQGVLPASTLAYPAGAGSNIGTQPRAIDRIFGHAQMGASQPNTSQAGMARQQEELSPSAQPSRLNQPFASRAAQQKAAGKNGGDTKKGSFFKFPWSKEPEAKANSAQNLPFNLPKPALAKAPSTPSMPSAEETFTANAPVSGTVHGTVHGNVHGNAQGVVEIGAAAQVADNAAHASAASSAPAPTSPTQHIDFDVAVEQVSGEVIKHLGLKLGSATQELLTLLALSSSSMPDRAMLLFAIARNMSEHGFHVLLLETGVQCGLTAAIQPQNHDIVNLSLRGKIRKAYEVPAARGGGRVLLVPAQAIQNDQRNLSPAIERMEDFHLCILDGCDALNDERSDAFIHTSDKVLRLIGRNMPHTQIDAQKIPTDKLMGTVVLGA